MRLIFIFTAVSVLSVLPLFGCSMVETRYQLPTLNDGDPQSLINEEDLATDTIVSSIKGFCTDKSNCNETLIAPELNTSKGALKAIYTFSPYGLMTMPFADLEGRTIAVPSGEIGIVINHKYRKNLKKEKVLSVEKNYDRLIYSWTCPNGETFTEELGSEERMNLIFSNLTLMQEFSEGKSGDLYKVTYEHLEWDTVIWADLAEDKEYTIKLSTNKLIAPGGNVVGGENLSGAEVPPATQMNVDSEIMTENRMFFGYQIGDEFVVNQDCTFSINRNGKLFLGTQLDMKK